MARNKYQSDKRQKEMRKKLKKEEKEQRKTERSAGDGHEIDSTAIEPGAEISEERARVVEETLS